MLEQGNIHLLEVPESERKYKTSSMEELTAKKFFKTSERCQHSYFKKLR